MKTIVVTGGEGFVGSHLCARLVKDGHRVISLDNHFVPPAPRIAGVEYREGHTKDIEQHIPETPDIVYHLGEYSRVHTSVEEPELVEDLNIVGTHGVVEYWKKKKCKLVYAGSSTKFESRDKAPYTRAKAANTELVARVGEEHHLPYAVVYFYNVYGPGERGWDNFGTVVETFRQNVIAGRPHRVNAPGTQTRSFTHVLDTVEGLIVAGERAEGEGYTISSGETHSIREVAELFGGRVEIHPQTPTSRSAGANDSSKIRALGWRPTHTLAEYIRSVLGKKKILIFSLAYYPRYVSGAEAAVKEITDRIDDIEFHMITLRFDIHDRREEVVGRVQVHRVLSGSRLSKTLFPLAAALRARSLNHAHRFDGMWSLMTYMLLPAMVSKLLGVRIPHILTLQDGDSYEKVFHRLQVLPVLPLIDKGFRTAHAVQVISTYLATWPPLRGYSGELILIHNGANPRDLEESVSAEAIEATRRSLGKKPGEVWLVNTARLEPQKGNDTTIRALAQLPAHVHVVLVGSGSEEYMLKALAQELRLEGRVHFTGQVTREAVTAYRKAADIFVGPSRSEGLGNAFLSAMASRLPVVATRVGGLADFLENGQTGWVVRPDTPDDIARAVEDILAHPAKVAEIQRRAREMVENRFNWDAIAREMRKRFFTRV